MESFIYNVTFRTFLFTVSKKKENKAYVIMETKLISNKESDKSKFALLKWQRKCSQKLS